MIRSYSILLTFFLIISTPISAELAPENLPDLTSLENVLGQMATGSKQSSGSTPGAFSTKKGLITSGIIAPRTGASGRKISEMSQMLANGSARKEAALKRDFNAGVAAFEDYLEKENFQRRDMGVAVSAFFIICWELANHTELPPQSALNAGKMLTEAMAHLNTDLQDLDDTELDVAYDALISTAFVFVILTKAMEKQGDIRAANKIRVKAGELFRQVTGMNHSSVTITQEGHITLGRFSG